MFSIQKNLSKNQIASYPALILFIELIKNISGLHLIYACCRNLFYKL